MEKKKKNVKNLVHKKQSECHIAELQGPQLPMYVGKKQIKFDFWMLWLLIMTNYQY